MVDKSPTEEIDTIVKITLVTVSLTGSVLLLGGYFYARSYDPWLTPRLTQYMIVYWGFYSTIGPVLACAVFGDCFAALRERSIRWRIVFTICAGIGAVTEFLGQ